MKQVIILLLLAFTVMSGAAQNIGIGTTSPNASAQLDISSFNKGLLIPRMTQTIRTLMPSPANGLMVYDTTTNRLYQYQDGTWRYFLNNTYWNQSLTRNWVYNLGDSIGIGTSSPDARLEVIGNVKTSARIDAGGVVEAAGLSSIGTLYVNGTSLLQGNVTGNGSATFSSTITSNTGMAINDPAATLTLRSSSTVDKGFLQLSGDDVRIGTFSGNDLGNLIVRVNGANVINVTPSYNVGIGTASPQGKLHVSGRTYLNNGSSEALAIAGTSPYMQFYHGTTPYGFIQQAGSKLFMGVNNGDLQLDGQQVIIGSVSGAAGIDAYKLTVSGKMICEEVRVRLFGNWPDYVFSDDYKLPSLQQTEAFIKQHKHLPNIPPAAEIEKNGMDLGGMQKKMMEKIEELTLYIIDLQKQMDLLKKENQ